MLVEDMLCGIDGVDGIVCVEERLFDDMWKYCVFYWYLIVDVYGSYNVFCCRMIEFIGCFGV